MIKIAVRLIYRFVKLVFEIQRLIQKLNFNILILSSLRFMMLWITINLIFYLLLLKEGWA